PTQRKIAGILSAYDDLIENNLRRIRILEEMAQSLYREWFVHFRFPGHESTPLVDSPLGPIPEDWEVKAFNDAAEFINGFAFKPKHLGKSGIPIIKIKELKNGIVADTPRYDGDEIKEKYHITNGDLLFSWSAHLDAYIWNSGDGYLNQHLFNVVPETGLSRTFLYFALLDRMHEFRSRSQGTTMRHIKRSALSEVSFVLPSKNFRSHFEDTAIPALQKIENLVSRNRNLRQTRDLLLPKLLSP
ncbi:MAG: restriction endonuclease subunit S, partial [Verrucomicrobiales bacterium]|nr:restriction endonuclease subunit S [Verrucomicrobiales bacterium]